MATVRITLTGLTDASKSVGRLRELIDGGTLSAATEVAAVAAVKKRLLQQGKKQNRLGGVSTNYWMRAADSVTSSSAKGTAEVKITQRGVALHLYGGTIRPKGTSEITGKPIKFLTIPKVAAAHGKTVAMLRALGVDLYPGRGGLLRQSGATRDPQGDEMWFALARQATIKPDATVVPSAAALAVAAEEAIRKALAAADSSPLTN